MKRLLWTVAVALPFTGSAGAQNKASVPNFLPGLKTVLPTARVRSRVRRWRTEPSCSSLRQKTNWSRSKETDIL